MTNEQEQKILDAAQIYKKNRDKQEVEKWNKETDQKALFEAMKDAGLEGINVCAGTHVGFCPSENKLFIVDIGDDIMHGYFKNFGDFLRSLNKMDNIILREDELACLEYIETYLPMCAEGNKGVNKDLIKKIMQFAFTNGFLKGQIVELKRKTKH